MTKQVSTGKCFLCNRTLNKGVITKHLRTCLASEVQSVEPTKAQGAKKQGRSERLFHLIVEGRYQSQYWMHLEVPAKATLADLDGFLRYTWLECCGHLSAFRIGATSYTSAAFDEMDDQSMDVKLERVVMPGAKFFHEYDFGTTTELSLKLVSEREGNVRGKVGGTRLLARNDAPLIPCTCGKAATQVCASCGWSDEGWLCDDCGEEHECGAEMLLPVVNSPRVGVCGYTGHS